MNSLQNSSNSIFLRIILIFYISIILFAIIFFFAFKNHEEQLISKVNLNCLKIVKYVKENRLRKKEIIEYVKDKEFISIKKPRNLILQSEVMDSGPGYQILKKDDDFYLLLRTPHFRLLLKDLSVYELNYSSFIILAFTFIVFVLTFLWILSALKPLKKLRNEIKKFSQGNLNIDCKSDKKDEIAQLGNEFDNAAKKIALLLESRQLFLRTVMHELKTPIAKGRIVSELIDDEKQRNRIVQIFEKLNLQIDDFARIEQIVSQNYSIKKHKFSLERIIKNSIDMMMLDKEQEKIFLENISLKNISADLDLLSLAFKNLIDNALKYSIDKKVLIEEKENSLLFISKGNRLSKPLKEYFKPFHNEVKSKNHGMGLGLYIVNSIIQMHKMKFEYEYKNNRNIFKITY